MTPIVPVSNHYLQSHRPLVFLGRQSHKPTNLAPTFLAYISHDTHAQLTQASLSPTRVKSGDLHPFLSCLVPSSHEHTHLALLSSYLPLHNPNKYPAMSDIVFNDMGGDMPEIDESEIDLELEEEVRTPSLSLPLLQNLPNLLP